MPNRVLPGRPSPLGATWDGDGVNFALYSENATEVEVCLFDSRDLAKETEPISTMVTRSLFAFPLDGARVKAGQKAEVNGVAFDGGKGIAKVEVSTDGGKSWADAKLDPEIGKFSFRRWRYGWTPAAAGHQTLMCRATNTAGQTQVTKQWNRSGYARNVIEKVEVTVEG